jgi:hypothetical protein
MVLLSAVLALLLAAPQAGGSAPTPVAPTEKPVAVVGAPDAPVRLDSALFISVSQGPPLLYYAATNVTGDQMEQFMVTAFIYDAQGILKVRDTAPGRRTLDPHSTKYSTLVLDGIDLKPTDIIVLGVVQTQKVGTDEWWRTNLQAAADAAAHGKRQQPTF